MVGFGSSRPERARTRENGTSGRTHESGTDEARARGASHRHARGRVRADRVRCAHRKSRIVSSHPSRLLEVRASRLGISGARSRMGTGRGRSATRLAESGKGGVLSQSARIPWTFAHRAAPTEAVPTESAAPSSALVDFEWGGSVVSPKLLVAPRSYFFSGRPYWPLLAPHHLPRPSRDRIETRGVPSASGKRTGSRECRGNWRHGWASTQASKS